LVHVAGSTRQRESSRREGIAMQVVIMHAGFERGMFYVMDRFGRTPREALVSGPFLTAGDADRDRRSRNIAADCDVCREACA